MGLRRYIFSSIIVIIAIGVFVYSKIGQNYTLEFFGLSLELPVAIWVIIPTILLMVASALHIFAYSLKYYLEQRSLKKDAAQTMEAINNVILGEKKEYEAKTGYFKEPLHHINFLKYDPKCDRLARDENIGKSIDIVKKIDLGEESVEFKKLKLNTTNPYVIKNNINEALRNIKYAETVLKKEPDREGDLAKAALLNYVNSATFNEIVKIANGMKFDKQILWRICDRINASQNAISIKTEEFAKIIKDTNLSKNDYIYLAKKLKGAMNPDGLIALFENQNLQENGAAEAYLYILFDLQMIDKIREILDGSTDGEFQKFKNLLFLRDKGKQFNIDVFFDG